MRSRNTAAKLTSTDVAEALGVSTARVRALAREGRLVAAATTSSGTRLYDHAELDRLAAERSRKASK